MTENAKKGRQMMAIIGLFYIAQSVYVNWQPIFDGNYGRMFQILMASVICFGLVNSPKVLRWFVVVLLILSCLIGVGEYVQNGISSNVKLAVDIVVYLIEIIFAVMLIFDKKIKEYSDFRGF